MSSWNLACAANGFESGVWGEVWIVNEAGVEAFDMASEPEELPEGKELLDLDF